MQVGSAIVRCGWPSTRSIAQSSRWRSAKSRAAMPTATAASSAASSATRLRNFSARSSVWRISGRPDSSDSTRTPRSRCVLDAARRPDATNSRTAHRRRLPRRRRRHREPVGHAAGGLDQRRWPARSASCSITRGAKLMKPAPRSGSSHDDARDAQLRVAEQQRVADLQRRAPRAARHRPRRVPRSGARARPGAGVPPAVGARAACRAADSRRSPPSPPPAAWRRRASSGARAMLGKAGDGGDAQAELRAPLRRTRRGVGWSLATIASPPSSWRASRARPLLSRSAKKPTAVSAATASITATTSRRSSPARKSRASWRQASRPERRRRARREVSRCGIDGGSGLHGVHLHQRSPLMPSRAMLSAHWCTLRPVPPSGNEPLRAAGRGFIGHPPCCALRNSHLGQPACSCDMRAMRSA